MKIIISLHFENLRNLVDYIGNSMHKGTMAQMENETKGISGGNAWSWPKKRDDDFDGKIGLKRSN